MQEEQRRQTAMSPKNYEFRLVTYERTGEQGSYILEVTPRIKNKFLFSRPDLGRRTGLRGGAHGSEPAKNPSCDEAKCITSHMKR